MSLENFPFRNGTQDRLSKAMSHRCGLAQLLVLFTRAPQAAGSQFWDRVGEQCSSAKVLSSHVPQERCWSYWLEHTVGWEAISRCPLSVRA